MPRTKPDSSTERATGGGMVTNTWSVAGLTGGIVGMNFLRSATAAVTFVIPLPPKLALRAFMANCITRVATAWAAFLGGAVSWFARAIATVRKAFRKHNG